MQPAYPAGKPISEKKKNDLIKTLPIVPFYARPFYHQIISADAESLQDDVDGFHQGDIIFDE